MRQLPGVSAMLALAASCTSSGPPAEIRVAALDCEFRFPASYAVHVGPDSRVGIYSNQPMDAGLFEIEPLAAAYADGALAPTSSDTKGPLMIERYSLSDESPPMVLIKGQAQQLKMIGVTPAQVDDYIEQCLDTMDPAVLALSERRAKGCRSVLSFDAAMRSIIANGRPQPVFSSGRLIGWRIYDIDNSSALWRAGIRQGAMLTHICGVPAEELMATPADICCESDTSREIAATFRTSGDASQTVSIERGT